MELTDYIRILRKNWVIIVVATLVGIGVGAVWSLTRTPEYEAQSTVFVSTQAGSTIQELQQGSSFTQSRVQTYSNLVTTPIVMNPVIAELDLGMTAGELGAEVEASAALNTTLITITVTDTDPVRAADIANALGASLTSAVEKLETPNGTETSPVRLSRVKDALPPLTPSSPNVPLNLALGGLIGLALGIGIAVLRAVLDTRLRTPRDVEQITDRPIIGAIAFDPRAKERPLIVHADPLSPRAESFRALRTNLQFLDMGGRSSFVITSSVPNEGKSTSTINLAIALADAGKKVALLDTDLRKPKVAEYLGIEGGVGLTDVLIGRARLSDVMLPWGNRSLYVLPAGKVPPNPSELLGSDNMHTLLEVLERDFDVVLCDAPPLLPVTDAAILAKATSGAIVMVSAGHTNRHQLSSALDALETVGARIAGITLTMVPTRGPDAYAYGYGYGYGGGYGYSQRPDAKASKRARGTQASAASSKPDEPASTRAAAPPATDGIEIPPRPAQPVAPAASSRRAQQSAAADGTGTVTLDDIVRQAGSAPGTSSPGDPLP
ncbi:polysaccharide biosynthesis tyrosine autokinase [Microbacterium kyungheense]|uniref:non-specific protein-tyrosine kinase n=1 Tax=Microbacterium kyungheense TaxID=1263636 RepID=A0A543FJP0_9MICO|nr:polysaccharide biosynthesis tyrosine autokinase [Microbacterium kyungheense]TQM34100.1 capsular exopolysaccharide synthesis family protein [Microbacterium kyungheense]